jgi:hypothetical protein
MICSNTNAFAASYNLGDESVQSHISSSTNLGTLSYWYSNTDIISHWKTPRKIYVSNLSSNSSFDLGNYVGFAIYQWSSKAQISCSANGTENSHSIVIYGGLESDLTDAGVFSDCSSANGKCRSTATIEGTYTYGSLTKTGKVTTYSKIAIIEKSNPRTDMAYSKTATHELGHALGYAGHSTTKGDIMYTSSTSNTTNALTTRDINHLKQIY